MECACISVDVDDFDESIDYINCKEVTATKEFKCVECSCTIQKGAPMEVLVMGQLNSGNYNSYCTCEDCLSMRIGLFCNYYVGAIWDTLWDELDNSDGDIKFDAIPKMTKIAREKVCDMLDRYYAQYYEDDDESN